MRCGEVVTYTISNQLLPEHLVNPASLKRTTIWFSEARLPHASIQSTLMTKMTRTVLKLLKSSNPTKASRLNSKLHRATIRLLYRIRKKRKKRERMKTVVMKTRKIAFPSTILFAPPNLSSTQLPRLSSWVQRGNHRHNNSSQRRLNMNGRDVQNVDRDIRKSLGGNLSWLNQDRNS